MKLHTILVAVLLVTPLVAQGDIPADTNVLKTASGLEYCVLKAGSGGAHPTIEAVVKVHYTGWLPDGKVFDSSRTKGTPLISPLKNLIKGWQEGCQLMSVGDRFKLKIPWALGYGEEGSRSIPPKTDLIFDMELIAFGNEPTFLKANADAQKVTKSGIKYEVIAPGNGEPCGDKRSVQFSWSCFTTDGKLVAWDRLKPMANVCSKLPVDFMKEMAAMMPVGAHYRMEVPAALAFKQRPFGGRPYEQLPPNSASVWELRMISIQDLPAFVKPDPAKLIKTDSGLRYLFLEKGDGAMPKPASTVRFQFMGWLEDGTMFDSSYARREPLVRPLNRTIPGWAEGLKLMPVGSKALFVVPTDLAYGPTPPPGYGIPANVTLIYMIELLEIVQ